MAVARLDNDWYPVGSAAIPPVPEVQVICAEDFAQVEEWRINPPDPTPAAVAANALYHHLLRTRS
jgi:hypothetical protein